MSNELDKQFSNRLTGYESELDTEALWEAVRPTPRKRYWPWLLLLLLLVGGLGGAYLWTTNTAVTQQAAITTDTEQVSINTMNTEVASIADVAKGQGSFTNSNNELERQFPIASSPTRAGSLQEVERAVTIKQPTLRADQTIDTEINLSKKAPNTETTTTDEIASAKEAELSSVVEETVAQETPPELETMILRNDLGITTAIATLNANPLPTTKAISLPEITAKSSKQDKPWFFQLEAGYFQINRRFSNPDSLPPAWLDTRTQTESLLEATSLDLTLGYRLNKRWSLRSGVAYTQLNTSFNYASTSSVVDSIGGTQVLVTTTNREKQTFNSFRQVELPLLLSYDFGSSRLYWQAEAGVRLLVNRTWEGTILDAEEEFVDLAETDWYSNDLGISLQAGLKLVYDLNKRTSVLGGLNVRYYPQAFTNDMTPIQENYQQLGVSVGLRHNF